MPSVPESVCCHEIGQIWQKIEEQTEVQMSCITEHPGFQSTCMDVWVLETAYYAYRQQHGTDSQRGHDFIFIPTFFHSFVSRKFRYIAYRQLVRCCWGLSLQKSKSGAPFLRSKQNTPKISCGFWHLLRWFKATKPAIINLYFNE
ncbi:unnamed protein product [Porites evermanni]|uniref:Uncharacterized protein n=1 Tax=Porites evermanni TaxID=104178 RepID=A0ABN8MTX4_9CNID|nr:unnamed protein product [Porites evermanni]